MSELAKCRSCKAPVRFVKTDEGNWQILDAEPAKDGNVVLIDGVAHTIRGDLWEQNLPQSPRYKDHDATCPNAAAHRKRKGGAR